jgi:hypothetical protein
MRFHVVSLPHTNTTEDFTACAYTEKVRKFCIMMKNLGHIVYLYAGEFNEAPCDEHIVCITEEQRLQAVGNNHYSAASFDWNLPHWKTFNGNAIKEIGKRLEQKDFICLISGFASKPIADAFPQALSVEFGIGYGGSFADFKVFESYAWMHSCYGSKVTDPHALDGKFFDTVIPSYIDVEDFPLQETPDDYVLSTNETHSVREMIEKAFGMCGFKIKWEGSGVNEIGYNESTGQAMIFISEKYYRPAEVDILWGDSTKARTVLGWNPKTSFDELIKLMVINDTKYMTYIL